MADMLYEQVMLPTGILHYSQASNFLHILTNSSFPAKHDLGVKKIPQGHYKFLHILTNSYKFLRIITNSYEFLRILTYSCL